MQSSEKENAGNILDCCISMSFCVSSIDAPLEDFPQYSSFLSALDRDLDQLLHSLSQRVHRLG